MTPSQIWANYLASLHSVLLVHVLNILITIGPLALTAILAVIFWDLWMQYVQAHFLMTLGGFTLLEIKLPKDTFKSPAAMEAVLAGIHNTSDGSLYAKIWNGESRPYYSLEIVSLEGQVKFFIWTESRRKAGLMVALYSQFPTLEIREVSDYAHGVHYDPKTMKVFACEFKKARDEDAYPIKTYVDYGLDDDPKEEFKTDPMSSMLEWMSTLGPNQQAWVQILVRAHIKDKRKHGHLFKKTDKWDDDGKKLIDKLMMRNPETKVAGLEIKDKDGKISRIAPPSLGAVEKEVIEAVERSLTKFPFDVGIRAAYISDRKTFDTPHGIGGIMSSFKQFSSVHLNGFKSNGKKWIAQFDYPWQDYKNMRRNALSKKFIKAYKRRSFFFHPYKGKSFVLNAEELATLYHFPGAVSAAPGLDRVPSKKGEAPANLPS